MSVCMECRWNAVSPIPVSFSQEGVSALHLAAEGNHTACMELLLMAGAKVDLKNRVRAPVVPVYNHRSLHRTVRFGIRANF